MPPKRFPVLPDMTSETPDDSPHKLLPKPLSKSHSRSHSSLINNSSFSLTNKSFAEDSSDSLLSWIDSLKLRANETFQKQKNELLELRKSSQQDELRRKYRESIASESFDKLGEILKAESIHNHEVVDSIRPQRFSVGETAENVLKYRDSPYPEEIADTGGITQNYAQSEEEDDDDIVEIISDESAEEAENQKGQQYNEYDEELISGDDFDDEEEEEDDDDDDDDEEAFYGHGQQQRFMGNPNQHSRIQVAQKTPAKSTPFYVQNGRPRLSDYPSSFAPQHTNSSEHDDDDQDDDDQDDDAQDDDDGIMESEDLEELNSNLDAAEDMYSDELLDDEVEQQLETRHYSKDEKESYYDRAQSGHVEEYGYEEYERGSFDDQEVGLEYGNDDGDEEKTQHHDESANLFAQENIHFHEGDHESGEGSEIEEQVEEGDEIEEEEEEQYEDEPNAVAKEEVMVLSDESADGSGDERSVLHQQDNFHEFSEQDQEDESQASGSFESRDFHTEEQSQNQVTIPDDKEINMNYFAEPQSGVSSPENPEVTEFLSQLHEEAESNLFANLAQEALSNNAGMDQQLNDELAAALGKAAEESGAEEIPEIGEEKYASVSEPIDISSENENGEEAERDLGVVPEPMEQEEETFYDSDSNMVDAESHIEPSETDDAEMAASDIAEAEIAEEHSPDLSFLAETAKFPLFKTIAVEDPKTILKQLKATERKFQIKLDAVEQLTGEVGEISDSDASSRFSNDSREYSFHDAVSSDVDESVGRSLAAHFSEPESEGISDVKRTETRDRIARAFWPKLEVPVLAEISDDESENSSDNSLETEQSAADETESGVVVIEPSNEEAVLMIFDDFTEVETASVLAPSDIREPEPTPKEEFEEFAFDLVSESDDTALVNPTEIIEPEEGIETVIVETFEESIEVAVPTSVEELESMRSTPVSFGVSRHSGDGDLHSQNGYSGDIFEDLKESRESRQDSDVAIENDIQTGTFSDSLAGESDIDIVEEEIAVAESPRIDGLGNTEAEEVDTHVVAANDDHEIEENLEDLETYENLETEKTANSDDADTSLTDKNQSHEYSSDGESTETLSGASSDSRKRKLNDPEPSSSPVKKLRNALSKLNPFNWYLSDGPSMQPGESEEAPAEDVVAIEKVVDEENISDSVHPEEHASENESDGSNVTEHQSEHIELTEEIVAETVPEVVSEVVSEVVTAPDETSKMEEESSSAISEIHDVPENQQMTPDSTDVDAVALTHETEITETSVPVTSQAISGAWQPSSDVVPKVEASEVNMVLDDLNDDNVSDAIIENAGDEFEEIDTVVAQSSEEEILTDVEIHESVPEPPVEKEFVLTVPPLPKPESFMRIAEINRAEVDTAMGYDSDHSSKSSEVAENISQTTERILSLTHPASEIIEYIDDVVLSVVDEPEEQEEEIDREREEEQEKEQEEEQKEEQEKKPEQEIENEQEHSFYQGSEEKHNAQKEKIPEELVEQPATIEHPSPKEDDPFATNDERPTFNFIPPSTENLVENLADVEGDNGSFKQDAEALVDSTDGRTQRAGVDAEPSIEEPSDNEIEPTVQGPEEGDGQTHVAGNKLTNLMHLILKKAQEKIEQRKPHSETEHVESPEKEEEEELKNEKPSSAADEGETSKVTQISDSEIKNGETSSNHATIKEISMNEVVKSEEAGLFKDSEIPSQTGTESQHSQTEMAVSIAQTEESNVELEMPQTPVKKRTSGESESPRTPKSARTPRSSGRKLRGQNAELPTPTRVLRSSHIGDSGKEETSVKNEDSQIQEEGLATRGETEIQEEHETKEESEIETESEHQQLADHIKENNDEEVTQQHSVEPITSAKTKSEFAVPEAGEDSGRTSEDQRPNETPIRRAKGRKSKAIATQERQTTPKRRTRSSTEARPEADTVSGAPAVSSENTQADTKAVDDENEDEKSKQSERKVQKGEPSEPSEPSPTSKGHASNQSTTTVTPETQDSKPVESEGKPEVHAEIKKKSGRQKKRRNVSSGEPEKTSAATSEKRDEIAPPKRKGRPPKAKAQNSLDKTKSKSFESNSSGTRESSPGHRTVRSAPLKTRQVQGKLTNSPASELKLTTPDNHLQVQDDSKDHPALRTRSRSPIKRSIQELSTEIDEPRRKRRNLRAKPKKADLDEAEKEQDTRGRSRMR